MKLLFVTHDTGIYGASRSLQNFLKNFGDPAVTVDLVVNRKISGKNDMDVIRERFGLFVRKIIEFYLPVHSCWMGAPPLSSAVKIKNFISLLTRGLFRSFVRKEKYDFIILNSLVLYSLINKESKYFVIVRESFNKEDQNALQYLVNASGLIFIDEATERSLLPLMRNPIPHRVINNPFDMTTVSKVSPIQVPFRLTKTTVVSLIGQISESKGTDFIIRAFNNAKLQKTHLLIVGSGDDSYIGYCKNIAGKNPNITFYGEVNDIERVYAMTDYVIRGESFPCIGRTVYEGLYSGLRVIIPGDLQTLPVESGFENLVIYYEPRNEKQLSEVLEQIDGSKVEIRTGQENVHTYAKAFLQFIKGEDTIKSLN